MTFDLDFTKPELSSAIIAAAVALVTSLGSIPIRHYFERRMLGYKLSLEHQYEHKKNLRNTISRYHGLLLATAETLNYRIWNIYENQDAGWLKPQTYANLGYYFYSTIYRFVGFLYAVCKLEREAIYIDTRIAEKNDLDIVKLCKALLITLTDIRLFHNLAYDRSTSTDHFYTDLINSIPEIFAENGALLEREKLKRKIENTPANYAPFLDFFSGLNAQEEGRYRWDRLVVFHIFLMVLLNRIGYDVHKSGQKKLQTAAHQIRHPEVAYNVLTQLLPTLTLDKTSQREISKALSTVASTTPAVASKLFVSTLL